MSTALLSQGTTVSWGGSTLTNITRVTIGGGASESQEGGPEVSIAHLGSCHCKEEPFLKTWAAPASEGDGNNQVQVDFMGQSPFTKDQIANFAISGQASFSFTDCTCVSVQTTASVGDVLRGSATIRFA